MRTEICRGGGFGARWQLIIQAFGVVRAEQPAQVRYFTTGSRTKRDLDGAVLCSGVLCQRQPRRPRSEGSQQ